MKIEDCGFSVRVLNGLLNQGVKTVRDLGKIKECDFLRIKNLGHNSWVETQVFLKGIL